MLCRIYASIPAPSSCESPESSLSPVRLHALDIAMTLDIGTIHKCETCLSIMRFIARRILPYDLLFKQQAAEREILLTHRVTDLPPIDENFSATELNRGISKSAIEFRE